MIRRISDTKNESNSKKKRFNENEETDALVRLNGEQSVFKLQHQIHHHQHHINNHICHPITIPFEFEHLK